MPPKILLTGNILNNGYMHARYLRKYGVTADSLNVDYKHCQGQPEWAEVEFSEPVAEENPDWSQYDLKGFRRPDWFFDVAFNELASLASRLTGAPSPPPRTKSAAQTAVEMGYRVAEKVLSTPLAPAVRAISRLRAKAREVAISSSDAHFIQSICDDFRAAYPGAEKALCTADVLEWLDRARGYGAVMRLYDLAHCLSLDPIYAMLGASTAPFIAYEHGTMREFPFEDSARGRLYALSLKKAARVLITNADCNRSAERLGLTNYRFIPHIIDDDLFQPDDSPLRRELLAQTGAEFILVAPARHHWKNFPQGLEHSWSKRNDVMIRGLGRLFSERPNLRVLVIMFEWGREVELSKALIAECGFADRVKWVPICSKPMLKKYYNACDLVLDQFNDGIGTFGAVVPESFACAKPVMLNYKEELHHWCFPVLPPVVTARSDSEVTQRLTELLQNPGQMVELGREGRRWFERHHSSRRVIDILIDTYADVLGYDPTSKPAARPQSVQAGVAPYGDFR
ncbi:MAG: glycosyltransferase family 4 protein [Pseudomonadota bacterium]